MWLIDCKQRYSGHNKSHNVFFSETRNEYIESADNPSSSMSFETSLEIMVMNIELSPFWKNTNLKQHKLSSKVCIKEKATT